MSNDDFEQFDTTTGAKKTESPQQEYTRSSQKQKPASRKKTGLSVLGRAINYLSRREHSIQELKKKLAPYVESEDELDAIIKQLEAKNLLSNHRFAQSVVHQKAAKQGHSKIISTLKQHKIDDATINDLSVGLQETEFERAYAVWQRKFKGQKYQDSKEYAKQMRFMISRGFSSSVVNKIIASPDEFEFD